MDLTTLVEEFEPWMLYPAVAQPLKSPHLFSVLSYDSRAGSPRYFQSAVAALMDFLHNFDMSLLNTSPVLFVFTNFKRPSLLGTVLSYFQADKNGEYTAHFSGIPPPNTQVREFAVDIMAFVQLMSARKRLHGTVDLTVVLSPNVADVADPSTYPLTRQIAPARDEGEPMLVFKMKGFKDVYSHLMPILQFCARGSQTLLVARGTYNSTALEFPAVAEHSILVAQNNARLLVASLRDPRLVMLGNMTLQKRSRRRTGEKYIAKYGVMGTATAKPHSRRRQTGIAQIVTSMIFGTPLPMFALLDLAYQRPHDYALAQLLVRKQRLGTVEFHLGVTRVLLINTQVCARQYEIEANAFSNGIIEFTINDTMSKQAVSPDTLLAAIDECGSAPLSIPINLFFLDSRNQITSGHANWMFIHLENGRRVIEHFEPHGSKFQARWATMQTIKKNNHSLYMYARDEGVEDDERYVLTVAIKKFIVETIAAPLDAAFEGPNEQSCEIQRAEEDISDRSYSAEQHSEERYGMCSLWRNVYMFMRLRNPTVPKYELQRRIDTWVKTNSNGFTLPVAYAAEMLAAMPDEFYDSVVETVVPRSAEAKTVTTKPKPPVMPRPPKTPTL